jgi:hypothetical protein
MLIGDYNHVKSFTILRWRKAHHIDKLHMIIDQLTNIDHVIFNEDFSFTFKEFIILFPYLGGFA